MILHLAVSVEHRLVSDRQTDTTTTNTALAWRRAVKQQKLSEKICQTCIVHSSFSMSVTAQSSGQFQKTALETARSLAPSTVLVLRMTTASGHSSSEDQ